MKNTPPVWKMLHEAMDALGNKTTNAAIRGWVLDRYPHTNKSTLACQIIICTVNHDSRIHYPENKKPRAADTQHDFLFRSGRGQIELYDPARHGKWEIYEEEDGRLKVRLCGGGVEPDVEPPAGNNTFAAEDHLRDYLAQHLEEVEPGLQLYADDDSVSGVEFETAVGRIDILAVDKKDGFVVIELKVSRGPDSVAGQILRYKNWVKKNLAGGRKVRGIIIAQHISEKIKYAIAGDAEIGAMEYEINLRLKPVCLEV